jgi:hypothetical protein
MGLLIFMVVFLLMVVSIGGSARLAGAAYHAGNTPLSILGLIGLVLSLLFCFWFSIPPWGGKWMERAAKRYYEKEGDVSLSSAPTRRDKVIGGIAGTLYGSAILASIYLSSKGFIPTQMMQPVSALYVVPFLVFLGIKLHRQAGWIPLLWPILYTLHAVLVVMGAPIQFEGQWQSLNMLVPIAGYGLITGLIGHFYGRYALNRLRRIAGEEK